MEEEKGEMEKGKFEGKGENGEKTGGRRRKWKGKNQI